MGIRRGVAVLLVGALVGCVPGLSRSLPTDRNVHDRVVEELEERAAEEEGWLVLPLPNLHEGGGTTTWWLHPCDPGARDRIVTRTAFHGSDVAGLPGHHDVEQRRLPCEEPTRDVEPEGRSLRLDVDALALGRGSPHRLALLVEREEVEIVDAEHATTHRAGLLAGAPTYGPCDGRTHWSARLESPRELTIVVSGCLGVLAVLPDPALTLLLVPPSADVHVTSNARIADGDVEAFVAALSAAGYAPREIRSQTFEEVTTETIWVGPCGPAPDRDGDTHTMVDVNGGVAGVSERAC
jgi:hypothetical protein